MGHSRQGVAIGSVSFTHTLAVGAVLVGHVHRLHACHDHDHGRQCAHHFVTRPLADRFAAPIVRRTDFVSPNLGLDCVGSGGHRLYVLVANPVGWRSTFKGYVGGCVRTHGWFGAMESDENAPTRRSTNEYAASYFDWRGLVVFIHRPSGFSCHR